MVIGVPQRRFHEPTKEKGWRNVFRKAGYQLYLGGEAYTSKRCFNCKDSEANFSRFRRVLNPRPWKNNIVLRNGLIKCNQCNTLWNRDLNGALNIYEVANCHVRGLGRPDYLTNQN
jgi:transposase